MFAETGLLYPYLQNFSQDVQPLDLEGLCHSQKSQSSMNDIFSSCSITDYDLGEGDLFKAPEPVIEESVVGFDPILDPMAAAMSMISCGGDNTMPTHGLEVEGMESLGSSDFFNEVIYDCKKENLGNTSAVTASETVDMKLPAVGINLVQAEEEMMNSNLQFQKSGSSGCLSSMDWVTGNPMRPSFLDFHELDFEAAYGMRRAFSEGDIKSLGNGNIALVQSPLQRPLVVGSCSSEDRLQKLSRYRNKKSRRNFGRKIKYACRKALADSQPRIRGRFAKTEESDICKREL